ncbi:MAG: hypothetical protein IKE05_02800, partial [Clostridia bacterium]|nr:hypothetical protein [Clostridia bacterium]
EKFKNLITEISKRSDAASLTLSDSLDLIDKNFDNIASSYGVEKTLSVPTVFSMKNYMNLHFYLTAVPKTNISNDLIPLPDSDLIEKDKDTVILKLTKRIDSLNTDLKLRPEAVNIRASQKLGKASSKIGQDSLIFTVNKFNTCELGKSSASISGLWERFKESQKDSLYGLFKNINNHDSNARYELQNIYSVIIANIKKKSGISVSEQTTLIKVAENVFRSFLVACQELSESESADPSSEPYKKATSLLDSILKLNYEFVWYPALSASNSK